MRVPLRTEDTVGGAPDSVGTACANPFCSCDPCRCETCKCGVVRLSLLERTVMELIWRRSPDEVTIRDVADELPEYAYTTVATVFDRLVEKNVLRRRLARRTKYYTPIGSSGAHTAILMLQALAADRDQASALYRFVSGLDHGQITLLREALDSRD